MYLPLGLVCFIGLAAGQIIGSNNNEERPPVGPITILPYPFPNNNLNGGSNDNRPNNLLTAFQNFFTNAANNNANNGAGSSVGGTGQPIQIQISTIRPPTNLLSILAGLVNRPQQQLQTTTTTTTSSTGNNPSTSTVVPILTPSASSTPTPTAQPSNANNLTRVIYSTLPFNFSDSNNGPASLEDFILAFNNQ